MLNNLYKVTGESVGKDSFINYPKHLFVTNVNHKGGKNPYYIEELYMPTLNQLTAQKPLNNTGNCISGLQGRNMEMSCREPSIIFIQTMDIEADSYIERLNDGSIYYIYEKSLYMLQESCLLKPYTHLEQSIKIQIPEGELLSLFSFNDEIYIIISQRGVGTIYKKISSEWKLIFKGINGPLQSYVITEDQKFLFFIEKIVPAIGKIKIYMMNNKQDIKILNSRIQCEGINCINIIDNQLLVALDKPHKIICIDVTFLLSPGESEKRQEYDVNFNDFLDYPCYNIIYNNDKILLFAANGQTELLNLKKEKQFIDMELGQSGFQIAAHAPLNLGNPYQLLGSWRRNQEHPHACFYILKNNILQYKWTDPVNGGQRGYAWTGYTMHCKSPRGNVVVFANTKSKPLYIRGFKNFKDFSQAIDTTDINLITSHDNLMVYSHTMLSSNNKKEEHIQKIQELQKFDYKTPDKKSNLYITIDVEQHLKGVSFCITGEGLPQQCGIYYIMDILEKYKLKGVFFINIYEHMNFNKLIEQIVHDIHERGHEVGLHCHKSDLDFNLEILSSYNYEGQKKIIQYGMDFIKKETGQFPLSFRGGGYAINDLTFDVLHNLGIQVDSSVFLAVAQNISYKTKNKVSRYKDVFEVPVTCHTVSGYPSKIDINWNKTAQYMMNLVMTCRNYGLQDIVVMLHSFSFISFTKHKEEGIAGLEFTSRRFAKGVDYKLMEQFEQFCFRVSQSLQVNVRTFRDACQEGAYLPERQWGTDAVPGTFLVPIQKHFCPICGHAVEFLPYRNRSGALCPVCHSLERMRFKMLYLKHMLNIEYCKPKKILHFGPALIVRNFLKNLPHLDYISTDPYSEADFKFSIEKIPFVDNSFDLILCIGVLMHVLDDRAAFQEMFRVLAPNGELLLWLGECEREMTLEYYNREDFSRMLVGDVSRPDNVHTPVVEERDGKLYYNPCYATRIYGKDIFAYLENMGFQIKLISASDMGDCEKYGIKKEELLISCTKVGEKGILREANDQPTPGKPESQVSLAVSLPSPALVQKIEGSVERGAMLTRKQQLCLAAFPPVPLTAPLDWHYDPLKNPDWQWSFHCFEFVKDLYAYYQKSHDTSALELAVTLVQSWKNTFGETSPRDVVQAYVWHDHSTALRAKNLCVLLRLRRTPWGAEHTQFWNELEKLLYHHGEILADESFYSRHTNHGLDQSFALLVLSLSVHYTSSGQWVQVAKERILSELGFSFTKEGIHKENSPSYHSYVLIRFTEIFESFPGIFAEKINFFESLVSNALTFLAYIVRPDGKYPIIGDTEWLRPSIELNNKYFQRLSAYPQFEFSVSRGREGNRPKSVNKVFPLSGYAVFRDAWHSSSDFLNTFHLIFKAGSLSRYHYHCDEGNWLFFAYGEDWIIDSGLYNYIEYDPVRRYARSRWAHNVPCVTGQIYDEDQKFSKWHVNAYSEDDVNPYIETIHQCLNNIEMKRRLEFNAEKKVIYLSDTVKIDTNKYDSNIHILFHIPEDKKITWNNESVSISKNDKVLNILLHTNLNFEIYVNYGFNRKKQVRSIVSNIKYTYAPSQCIHIVFDKTENLHVDFEIYFS